MKFYTGINRIVLLNKRFRLIQPSLPDIVYWKGPNDAKKFNKVWHRRCNTLKELSQDDELLLTLMRLRLRLLNENLVERSGVSPTRCSYIFTTWIKLLSVVLGKALVVWPPKKFIRENLSEIFLKSGHGKCRVITDCAEVFIEWSKSLFPQDATLSDYKHYNTFKTLVGITHTGFILFLCYCYGGQTSDKFITKDSGFYDLLERNDEIMADKGFQIQEDFFIHICNCLLHLVQG